MLGFGIKESTTTTGTGSLTLAEVSGYPQFQDRYSATTLERFPYTITDDAGLPIEMGIGYLSAASTLVREVIHVTWSGTAYTQNTTAYSLAAGTKYVLATPAVDSMTACLPAKPNTIRTANSRLLLPGNVTETGSFTGTPGNYNRGYYCPVRYDYGGKVDGFHVSCGAVVNVDIGLYTCNHATFLPSKLVASVANQTTASGVNVFGFTAITLNPGWYFVYMNFSAATASATTRYMKIAANPLWLGADGGTIVQQGCVIYETVTQGTLPTSPNPATMYYFTGSDSDAGRFPGVALRMTA